VASPAGIGGGAFYVALFYAASGFSLKAATGLSQAAIAGGSFVTMLFNLAMRHPWDPGRPLVDLDLALVLTPALLLGVSVGVLLNELLPTWGVLLLLVALLGFTCKGVIMRGLNTWAEEQQKIAAAHAAAAIQSGPVPRLAPIQITHVPSMTWPARLQVVISREASRAQIADSSDDEEGGMGGGGGGANSGRPRGGGSIGSLASPAAATPPAQQQQQQQQQGVQHSAEGRADEEQPAPGSARQPRLSSGLATVPSGDSEQLGSDGDYDGRAGPPDPRRRQDGLGHSGGGGGGGGSEGQLRDGGEGEEEEEDPFSKALESEQQRFVGDEGGGGVEAAAAAAAAIAAAAGGAGVRWAGGTNGTRGGSAFAGAAVVATPPSSAAAAAAPGPQTPAWLITTSPRGAARFPWIKLVSLTLLWLGFLGLSALDALLPLCSVQYIVYVLLFLVITLGVTVMVRGRVGGAGVLCSSVGRCSSVAI